ncbi:MAG: glycosyltransferase family 2 protein [Geobacter sp.]|nr:glycosyltransferase family 2 protein [Geobacter sp.]
MPKVISVIPVHNGREETLAFLESMRSTTYPDLGIVLVDDGSTDGTADAVAARFPEVTILAGNGNLWWSGATNLGVNEALERGAEFVLTINNDNVVEPGFLEPLVETAQSYPRSLVTSKMYDYSDRDFVFSFGGVINWYLGEIRDRNSRRDRLDFDRTSDCDWLHGSSTLIPAAVFAEIGLFDRENCPQYQGDAEFSLRAKRHGWRLLVEPRSVVYNRTAVSSGTAALNEERLGRMLSSFRSPFYLKANWKLYRDYCPCRPVILFFAIRYLRLAYSLARRRLVDRTRG